MNYKEIFCNEKGRFPGTEIIPYFMLAGALIILPLWGLEKIIDHNKKMQTCPEYKQEYIENKKEFMEKSNAKNKKILDTFMKWAPFVR